MGCNENSHWVRYKAINCKHVLLLFANYLCCALFFFQHYWKVLSPNFFFGKMDVSFEDISSKSRYSVNVDFIFSEYKLTVNVHLCIRLTWNITKVVKKHSFIEFWRKLQLQVTRNNRNLKINNHNFTYFEQFEVIFA